MGTEASVDDIAPLASLDPSMLRRSFLPRVAEKGAVCQREGRVLDCSFDHTSMQGSVSGRYAEPYRVRAWLEGNRIRTSCTCPATLNCAHGYALVRYWMSNREACTDLGRLRAAWSRMTREELIDTLVSMVGRYPEAAAPLVGECLLRSGWTQYKNDLLERFRRALGPPDEAHPRVDVEGAGVVLASVEGREGGLSEEAAADVLLSMYEQAVQAAHRWDLQNEELTTLAVDLAARFERVCGGLGNSSKDALMERSLRLFLRRKRDIGQGTVLLSMVTPGNADQMVRAIDCSMRSAPGANRAGRPSPNAGMTAAEVLVRAGRKEEAVNRLTVDGSDLPSIFRGVDLLIADGEASKAVDLMVANRPEGTSLQRREWGRAALKALGELEARDALTGIDKMMAVDIAASVLADLSPSSPEEEMVTVKKVLEALGGLGAFPRVVRQLCDAERSIWALVKGGEVQLAWESYRAMGRHEGQLAWAIADIAHRHGREDIREDMVREALSQGDLGDVRQPQVQAWVEDAVKGMDAKAATELLERATVPVERTPWLLTLIAAKDAGMGARWLDARSRFMRHEVVLSCLNVLGETDPQLAMRCGRTYALALLASPRRSPQAASVLRVLRPFSGMDGGEWSSFLRALMEATGDVRRVERLLRDERW